VSRPLKDGDVARVRMEANVSPAVRAEVDADRVLGESRGDVIMRWAQVRRDQRVVANRHALFARELSARASFVKMHDRVIDVSLLTTDGRLSEQTVAALGLSILHAHESSDDVAVYTLQGHPGYAGYVLARDGRGVVLRPQDTMQESA